MILLNVHIHYIIIYIHVICTLKLVYYTLIYKEKCKYQYDFSS